MDVVSEILSTIAVRNRVTGLLRLRGDWAFESPKADEAVFHLVFKGSVNVTSRGYAVGLNEGDMIMFTRGDAHVLASAHDAPMVTFAENDTRVRIHAVQGGEVVSVDKQSDGPETSIICARFNFSSPTASDLIASFPDQAVLLGSGSDSLTALEPVLRSTAAQAGSDQQGALAELDGLVNLLYLSFIRRWLMKSPPPDVGWIRGLRDPQIAKALQLMHSYPARSWSVQELASHVAMSRSTFAARFSEVTGAAPLRYLIRWRMMLAAQKLEAEPTRPIGDVALSVGYDSEAAFSSAFKRKFGKPPSVWRRDAALAVKPETRSA